MCGSDLFAATPYTCAASTHAMLWSVSSCEALDYLTEEALCPDCLLRLQQQM